VFGQLTPGRYQLEAWQERYGAQAPAVTVAAGRPTPFDFTFREPEAEGSSGD
jgi:hypothetical protein